MTRSRKLRDSARGRECQIRIPGHCNFNSETVVLCHVSGGGIGGKCPDILAAYGCSACHDAVDGRSPSAYSQEARDLMFWQGVGRTLEIMAQEGLIKW